MSKEYNFQKERVLKNEIIVYLMKYDKCDGFKDIIEGIAPLDFDNGTPNDYIAALHNDLVCQTFIEEQDCLYEDIEDVKNRLGIMDILGTCGVYFDHQEEDEIF